MRPDSILFLAISGLDNGVNYTHRNNGYVRRLRRSGDDAVNGYMPESRFQRFYCEFSKKFWWRCALE